MREERPIGHSMDADHATGDGSPTAGHASPSARWPASPAQSRPPPDGGHHVMRAGHRALPRAQLRKPRRPRAQRQASSGIQEPAEEPKARDRGAPAHACCASRPSRRLSFCAPQFRPSWSRRCKAARKSGGALADLTAALYGFGAFRSAGSRDPGKPSTLQCAHGQVFTALLLAAHARCCG